MINIRKFQKIILFFLGRSVILQVVWSWTPILGMQFIQKKQKTKGYPLYIVSTIQPFLRICHVHFPSISISVQLSTNIYLESHWRLQKTHSWRCTLTIIPFLVFYIYCSNQLRRNYSIFFHFLFAWLLCYHSKHTYINNTFRLTAIVR